MVDVQDKVLDYIENAGIGFTRGTNLFGPEIAPSSHVPVNALFSTTNGGPTPQRTMGSNEVRSPIINFLLRWNSYGDARAIALEVMNTLQGAEVSGLLFLELNTSDPDYISRDEEGNHRLRWGITVHYNQDA